MLVVPLGQALFDAYDGAVEQYFQRFERKCTVKNKRTANSTDFSYESFCAC